jgi:hypothetical protein
VWSPLTYPAKTPEGTPAPRTKKVEAGTMLPELLQKTSLFHLLFRIDTDLSERERQKGCPYCSGRLDKAYYERKPRGGPREVPDEYAVRQSLCCSRGDCRRRALPPSCLFMGRRVYWGSVILVVMALRQNRPQGASTKMLMEMFELSRETLLRWIAYFREEFPVSAQWQRIRGRVSPLARDSELPGGLLDYFIDHADSAEQGLVNCLRFLAEG